MSRHWIVLVGIFIPWIKRCSWAQDRPETGFFGTLAGYGRFVFTLLFLFALLGPSPAHAVDYNCSDFPGGVIDGTAVVPPPTQITLDRDCTIQNFTGSNPLGSNINFVNEQQNPEKFLIVFNNVEHSGQMSCNTVSGHKIWFVNGSSTSIQSGCQNLLIPAETIAKRSPAGQSSATIGVPFTYTLTLPSMNYPAGDPSPNDLHTVILWDDLAAMGVDLTLIDVQAHDLNTGDAVTLVQEDDPLAPGGVWTPTNLSYKPIPLISQGQQIVVEITVVLDDTAQNAPGTVFTNTAKWWFGRLIEGQFYEPLPGEWGISEPLTIAQPELVVNKSSGETALNLGVIAPFTIDVENAGGSDAWNVTVLDQLPDGATGGMCDYDPTASFAARLEDSGGALVKTLNPATDYTLSYTGAPTCELAFALSAAGGPIGPDQHLVLTYESQLDGDSVDGVTLTNVAGATSWLSSDGTYPPRSYSRTLTDGTPGVDDHEDSATITTALSGYYFQKTVQNRTTLVSPASVASPGDLLRYRLRLFNVDQNLNGVVVEDQLDLARFDLSSFAMVSMPAGAAYTLSPTGLLQVTGSGGPLDVVPGDELVIDFDIALLPTLVDGDEAVNQASFTAGAISALSDDPYVNGIAPPPPSPVVPDPTRVVIRTPGPLAKATTQATATIGETFSYRITVPATPLAGPLYDVRIVDDLSASAADLRFVSASVVSGGGWTLTNSGSDTSLVIEDAITGIDIPANGQAVIEITVQLLDTAVNNAGLTFTNSASYTYNRVNGNATTQMTGDAGSDAGMTVVEPDVVPSKSVTPAPPATPNAGDTLTYSISLAAQSGADLSQAFDVSVFDTLSLGLQYVAGTTQLDGVPVADPILGGGDGSSAPQTLSWSDVDIPAGTTAILQYQVEVVSSIIPNQVLSNSVDVQWSSLNGAVAEERTYTDTAAAPQLTTAPDSTSLAKTRVSDTFNAADANLRVGDMVEYELRLGLQPGTHTDLVLTDTLPAGVTYEAMVSVDLFGTPGTADPVVSGSTLQWDLGTLVNPGDGDPTNDFVVLRYRARVLNDTLSQQDTTPLTNTATLAYSIGGVPATPLSASATVTLLQPELTVSKSAAPAGGDTIINAGEVISYTVDIVNRGTAPAYDTVLVDTLPFGLRQGGVVTTGISLVTAGTSLPLLNPVFDAATGVATWNLDTGTADAYTIPAGETLRLVYQVTADAGLGAGLTLSNSAVATFYASFDDEAVPATGAVAQRQVYGPTNTAVTYLTTPTPGGPLKQNPADPTVTVGQEFTYSITVPATPQPTALHDVRILDNLAAISADLTFVGVSKIAGSQPWTPVNTGTATALVIEDTASGIDIPANEQIVVGVTVRLDNVAGNATGLAFSNLASYTYNALNNDPTSQQAGGSSATANMTVVEPQLTATKTTTNVTPGKAAGDPVAGGDILAYVITLTNGGTATAYDINLVDTLPTALTFDGGFTPTATIDTVPVSGFVATPAGAPAGPLVWGRTNGAGDGSLDLPAGSSLVLTYHAQVLESTVTSFSNQAWVDWTSLDGSNAFERTGAGCPNTTLPNDYCAGPASVSTTTIDNNSLSKAIVADSYDDAPSTAVDGSLRIGDWATYHLTLNLGEGITRAVQLDDVLPAGMAYDRLLSITPASGSGSFSYSLAAQPAAGATGTLHWDLGDVVNTPSNDGTPVDALVIAYRAKVLADAGIAQTPTTTLTNTATLSYQDAGGATVVDPARLTASVDLTLWQPLLTVTKAAAPAGGDSVIDAGEVITYSVDLVNSGMAPAYNPVVVDTLPVGLRQGGVTTTRIYLVSAGTDLPLLAPTYDPATGVASWDFDTGVANAYTIPAGETLRLVYQVTADADLGAGLTLTNTAQATHYYSFDSADIPPDGVVGDRQDFGATASATASLTTPTPGALLKEITQPTAALGEQFRYRITVPAVPVNTALHDVRILDDLSASGASLRFVSVAKISGSGSWTPVNTGTVTNLVIEDTTSGIDIPAGEQAVIEITVELVNTPANVIGSSFSNTADYTYNQLPDTPDSQTAGLPGTSEPMQIVGLAAQKTVAIAVDNGTPGLADPGDVLQYTITIRNASAAAVTGVALADDIPADTTYVADSVQVNGVSLGADGGVSPLAAGVPVQSVGSPSGTIAAGSSAEVTFRVQINTGVAAGTVISNQGFVPSNEVPTEPTDADGDVTNGYQPTTIVVGSEQQVMITKEVSVVGGGAALPGSQLEYLVRVTNTGATGVTQLVITDNLSALAGQATYVAGSASLNGVTAGVTYAAPVITADYAATYGPLPVGATATLRFRVLVNSTLPAGTRLTNTAQMAWNTPTLTATASASVDLGGVLGTATLNGQVWHDADLDKAYDLNEGNLAGWSVTLYRNSVQVGSTTTDANGLYQFAGLEPTLTSADHYELRFTAAGAGANTAMLGYADAPAPFINGMQRISNISVGSGGNLQNLNLPLSPNGVLYDAVLRTGVAGARVMLVNEATNTPLPSACFDDPVQQNQITAADGFYKFDLNFSDLACPSGGAYRIEVVPPATGFVGMPSQIIPPGSTPASPFSVSACPGSATNGDALPGTTDTCEVTTSALAPAGAPRTSATTYYLNLTLNQNASPVSNQAFNNHIPLDPTLTGVVTISKVASRVNVTKGEMVPYTITVRNTLGQPLYDVGIIDRMPVGFKYVKGSARLDGTPVEPQLNGRELLWDGLQLQYDEERRIQLLLVVGAGVAEGEYINRAQVVNTVTSEYASGEAAATVRIIPDADFDCTDVIGKVFDDRNLDGRQDPQEEGLAGVRLVTARGLISTTDEHGRFHITCATVPDEDRGSNFILKLDDRSLPSGYRVTTENPRVQRATRGKMLRFNFGATIHRVVSIDIADGVFEPGTTALRPQWAPKLDQLLQELQKAPSVLRLAYLADVEKEGLVKARLKALKHAVASRWDRSGGGYRLTIETEVFWRRGAPN